MYTNPLKSRDFEMKKLLSMIILMGLIESASAAIVGHTGKYWTVTEHDRSYKVGRESLDETLRNVNKYNMARFMQKGRVSAHKTSDGSYVLRGRVNGLGGGPVTGWLLYWGTKAVCYGTAAAAAGTAVVVTGGASIPAMASGVGVALGTAGASTGAGLVAAAIGTSTALTAEAVALTGGSLAAFGGGAGAIAAVESAATGLGLWGLSLPLP
jgi:hypothetical protein